VSTKRVSDLQNMEAKRSPIANMGDRRKNPEPSGSNAPVARIQRYCNVCGRRGRPADHGWDEHQAMEQAEHAE
jgi:hypothetical protein